MNEDRFYVDFNEMLAYDLVLFSKNDTSRSSNGKFVDLHEGLRVSIYMDDVNEEGEPDNLVAEGVLEVNVEEGWSSHVKWCCRIGSEGIRHESDL